jgi:acetolactate synthase-1/2/3 large subunit
VLPETHPLCLAYDAPGAPATELNRLVGECDLVLAVGCKLSHNGSHGFRLQLSESRLVRVDTAREVMGRAYPAHLEIEADARIFLEALLAHLGHAGGASDWDADEVGRRRARLSSVGSSLPEPTLAGLAAARFFSLLRDAIGETSVVSTDSGLHQYLVRRYFPVLAPRTLVTPADFQAMGFGIPAAIGAAVATGQPAVAIVGDGGLNIAGLELLTAVRERLRLAVVVLVDRHFGLIRAQQLRQTGHPVGVEIPVSDLELLAASVGAAHRRVGTAAERDLGAALGQDGVTIVEVPVEDTDQFARARAYGLALSLGRAVLGPRGPRRIADALRGRRQA